MADIQIYQLNPRITLQATDQFAVDDATGGHLTWKVTIQQLVDYVTSISSVPSQIIFITNNGVDAPGNGNYFNPFASLSYAFSAISPSSTVPYLILMQGVFTETNVAAKPWCAVDGNDCSSLTITGSLTLDSSWSSGGEFTLNHFFKVALPATVTLDFNAVSSPSSILNFSNNFLIGATDFNIVGDSTNGAVILIENNINLGSAWNFTITNCFGALDGGDTGNITINHSSETAGGNFNLLNLTIEGNLSLNDTTTSAGMSLFHQQCKNIGNTTYASNGSALVQVFSQGNLFFNAPTIDYGTSGGEVIFQADFLNALPALLNGAGYNPTTIADAILANAYFTPTSFTGLPGPSGQWVADSVTGYFAGIDAALTTIVGNNLPQIVYADSVTGNDGTANGSPALPYQTYGAAAAAKAASATQTNQYVIDLNGDFNESGGLNVYPFVSITSRTNATFNTSSTVTLDPSWDTTPNGFFRMDGFKLNAIQVFLQFTTYQNASMEFDVDLGSTGDFQVHGSGTTAGEKISIIGKQIYSGTSTQFEMSDVSSSFENVAASALVIANTNSNYASFTNVKNCQSIGEIFNNATSSQNSYLITYGSPEIGTITLQSNLCYLTTDSTSYTNPVVFAGTADINNLNILSLSDAVDCQTYTPIHFTSIPSASYGSNSLTAYIAGIDAALATVIPGTPIAQQLWVNLASGNDSHAGTMPDNALATYDVGAYPILVANASPTNPYDVYIIGDAAVTSDFNLVPYCNVFVIGGLLTIPGQLLLDSSFAAASNSTTILNGMINAVGGINLSYGAGDSNFINLNIDPTTTPSIALSTPPATSINTVWLNIIPNPNYFNLYFSSSISFQNVFAIVENLNTNALIDSYSTGSSGSALVLQNCQAQVQVDGTSGPHFFEFSNCAIGNMVVISTNATGFITDSASYPQSLTLSSGATISQVSISGFGSTDGLQFSTTFVPVNFSFVPGNWPIDSLTAALAGIDAQLATSGGGDLQDAYNAGTPGSQGLINLNTNNLNALITANSVRGSGSTLQRHHDAFNSVVPGTLGFWGNSYSGLNSSSAKVDYAYTAAFATNTTAGSETATWTLNVMQGGTPTTALHVNAAAQVIDTPYAIQNPGGAQAFNTKQALTGSLTYSGQLLGFNNISDDASGYTVTINTGGFALNLDDCFYIQTQGTNTVTLAPSGGATINGSTSNFVVPIYTKATVQLVNNSTKAWVVTYESSVSDISSGAFPFSYDAGNSSGISGTPTLVFGSYTVNGDFVTANVTISLNASSASVNLAFTAPFVSSFPIGNFSSATGSVFTDTIPGFGAIGLMGVLATTTSVLIPLAVTSVLTPFYVSLSFSYQFQNF